MRNSAIAEDRVAALIVDTAIHVHSELGPGLLESVYEVVQAYELGERGLRVQRQVAIPLRYKHMRFDVGFRADLLVDDLVLVELKSLQRLAPAHKKQLLTYLRITDHRLGLLLNFGEARLKNGITRVANKLPEHAQQDLGGLGGLGHPWREIRSSNPRAGTRPQRSPDGPKRLP